jgi:hypothetical protein
MHRQGLSEKSGQLREESMTDAPLIAYLDQQRQRRFQSNGRSWSWSTLADRAHLHPQTLYQLRCGAVEFNFRHWLLLHSNAQITVPEPLLTPEIRQQAIEYLRGRRGRIAPLIVPVPCGAVLDWHPETRCSHWRGHNAFQGSGCYLIHCPRRPLNAQITEEIPHE